jgi:4-oxalocrotonate tautomerase
MPLVQVTMIEGRNDAQKAALIRDVTAAVHAAIDAPVETVRVIITEVPGSNWGIGGITARAKGR